MIVVYSSSDYFAPITGISILSLLETNRDEDELRIYLIDNGISAENHGHMESMVHAYGREITFIPQPDLTQRLTTRLDVGRWHISTFFRLFLCSILPQSVQRCIFLDSDTLVRHSLKELWEMDLGECIAAAVDDCRSDDYKMELGAPPSGTYTNNGVLLIDLQRWRDQDVEKDFLDYIIRHDGSVTYVDQGVFNGVLGGSGLVKEIHPKYNALTIHFCFGYDELMRLRKPQRPMSRQMYKETVQDPCILHFQSCFMSSGRPWNPGNDHPFVGEFLACKARSPWRDLPLYQDNQKPLKQWMTRTAKRMPRGLMIAGMSLLHTKVYPFVRLLKGRLRHAKASDRYAADTGRSA